MTSDRTRCLNKYKGASFSFAVRTMKCLLTVQFAAFVLCFVRCQQTLRFGTDISEPRNYYEDTSLIGTEINCTDEEKECYKFNRVLQPDGKCYSLEHRGPCKNNFLLYFNKTKAQRGEYKAECHPWFKCGDPQLIFMAHDQTCYPFDLVLSFCKRERGYIPSTDYFGEYSCRCFGADCRPRRVVTQPETVGRCRLPDILQLDFPYILNPLYSRPYPCTKEEHVCLSKKMMLHHPSGKCFPLLERGPCEEGNWFVANKTAFQELRLLEGVCSDPACPVGQLRAQFDGRCYERNDVVNKLCPPQDIAFDVFGEVGCSVVENSDVGNSLPQYLTSDEQCTDWSYMTSHRTRSRLVE